MFNSSVLLPRNNITDPRIRVASNVIGTTLLDHEVMDLDDNITLILRLQYPVSIVNCVKHNVYSSMIDMYTAVLISSGRVETNLILFSLQDSQDPACVVWSQTAAGEHRKCQLLSS